MQHHRKKVIKKNCCKEKPAAKGHRPPSSSQAWLGRGRGCGAPFLAGEAPGHWELWVLVWAAPRCSSEAGLGGWEDFLGAEKIKLTFLWDDQSPQACCLRGAR